MLPYARRFFVLSSVIAILASSSVAMASSHSRSIENRRQHPGHGLYQHTHHHVQNLG